MSDLRPLPARPNLELERKKAKELARQLRAGDHAALERARARHPSFDPTLHHETRLADAQLVIAREYGFMSWPQLSRYFREAERQAHGHRGDPEYPHETQVRALLSEHAGKRIWTARVLAAYIPRLYGLAPDQVFAAAITEEEARLAIARFAGYPGWDALIEARSRAPAPVDRWHVDPMARASQLMKAGDLEGLKRLVADVPELLHPSEYHAARGYNLLSSALHLEARIGADAARPIIEWLKEQGLDLQHELNRKLCGSMRMQPDQVRSLLERGADPGWMPPNGVPVIEHAILRYWNAEAVDVLAARVKPRAALWIAAGLGDISGVASFLNRDGKPIPAVQADRPPWSLVGPMTLPQSPDATDEELLAEAFVVAMVNRRSRVMEYLASRGFSVNTLVWGSSLVVMAVGNGWTDMVACLIRCGADLDLRGWRPRSSARELAREMFEQWPEDPDRRRILELCGIDPDTAVAELEARLPRVPEPDPKVREALELARDDAFRLGQPDVGGENLLFGLLRGGLPLIFYMGLSRADLDRFREDMKPRVLAADNRTGGADLPLSDESSRLLARAAASARRRYRKELGVLHLLYALVEDDDGPAVGLLRAYGGDPVALRKELQSTIDGRGRTPPEER